MPNPDNLIRKLHKKKDSIKEIILSKLNLIENRKDSSLKLSEEQLIEHEMLTTNIENIFIDFEVQVNIKNETKERFVQAVLNTQNECIETDEILDYIEIEENRCVENFKKSRHLSIHVTNEKDEEIIAFSNLASRLNDISMISPENSEENINDKKNKPRYNKRVVKCDGFR